MVWDMIFMDKCNNVAIAKSRPVANDLLPIQ